MRFSRRPRTCVAITVVALCAIGLGVAARTGSGPIHAFDVGIARGLNRTVRSDSGTVRFWKAVSTLGGPVVWDTLGIALAVGMWLRGRRRNAGLIVVALVGATVLTNLLKVVVDRPRPALSRPVAHAAGLSFPSGHAMTSCVAVGVFVVLAGPARRRWMLGPGVVIVAAVGFSRIVLGVHYLTDVVAAWLIGGLWLLAVIAALGPSSATRRHDSGIGATSGSMRRPSAADRAPPAWTGRRP